MAKPRSSKQIESKKYYENDKYVIEDQCEITSMIEVSMEVQYLVKDLKLLPYLTVVLANKTLLLHVKNLYLIYSELELSYDTTYDIGDFYLSPLIFRHRIFIGEPGIPIGYLVHKSRDAESYKVFF